ncbi:MAG: S-methyl-5-thioribose-1-phosphate isomerase [Candidatus Cloacimonetes bacterium]|nr:S-methyl-5-thioribose-1-phosphate isomerase [Candidatus Cloacimonadota bacterium]
MIVNGKNYRTVWMEDKSVFLIEQNLLPFNFDIFESNCYKQTCLAIKDMLVRGAGAIGSAAGFAMAQAFLQAPEDGFWEFVEKAKLEIEKTRPTAQNLFHATNQVFDAARKSTHPTPVATGAPLSRGELEHLQKIAVKKAQAVADKDAEDSRKIGKFGNELIKDDFRILTHCNAGWLAFTDFGTALSPIYSAHRSGKNIFVYVDETRPRSQGARLTAWELKNENIPHVIVPDNAAAHLMQQSKIDLVIVGADRIAANGDVANKIGTLEKAICAREFSIPFFVAAPSSTFDIECPTGKDIPIEERSQEEVLYQKGLDQKGQIRKILVCSPGSQAYNPAFDVTPAKYITGIITEKGIVKPENISKIPS